MRSQPILAVLTASLLSFLGSAAQASITGTPIGDPVHPGWIPNSTNLLNYTEMTPGRVGQEAPYVLFDSATPGSVTLSFFNPAAGLAFFETRIDDIATGTTANPIVLGDTIHTGGTAVPSVTEVLMKTFPATSTVDIRLSLGGERNWDFNWTRFEVATAEIPEPTAALVWCGLSLVMGLALSRRRTHA